MSKIGDLMRELAIEVDKYFVVEESKQPAEVVTPTGQLYFEETFKNATKAREEHQKNLDFRGKWRLNDGRIANLTSKFTDDLWIGVYINEHGDSLTTPPNYVVIKVCDIVERVPEPNIY